MIELTDQQRSQLERLRAIENTRRARAGLPALSLNDFVAEYRARHAGAETFLDLDDTEAEAAAARDPNTGAAAHSILAGMRSRYQIALGRDGSSKSIIDRQQDRYDRACRGEADAANPVDGQ
jgi:hypothetical protein